MSRLSQICYFNSTCLNNGIRRLSTMATFQTKPFKLHRIDESPSTEVTCTREDALRMYKQMITVRRLEATAGALYKEKAVRGFCHLYAGQEAICEWKRKSDAVITAYRAHGWTYMRGVPLTGVLGELMGRRIGCVHGKGGSMHMFHDRFYGGNGIVGAQIPIGAGIALAQKLTNSNEVTLALGGDGAANQGQVFEAHNMAKLWSLPVIFVTENNGYAMGTSTERSSACTEYYTRGDYIPGMWVDGMDVLAVKEATAFLVKLSREGKGPFVMEVATYRYSGHSLSDPGTSYRTREEIQEVRKTRDPITLFKEKITDSQLVSHEELKEIDTHVRKEVDEAVLIAKSTPELNQSELYGDVYAHCVEQSIRGVIPFARHDSINTGKIRNL